MTAEQTQIDTVLIPEKTTRIFLSEVGFAVPFEAEPPEPFDIGPLPTIPEVVVVPSSVRTYHRLDMPSATDIPAILESRL